MGAQASGDGGGEDACCSWCDGHHECPYGQKVYGLQVTLPHEHNLIDLIAVLFSAVPYYLMAHVLAYSLMRRRVRETSWLFFVGFVAVVSGSARELVDSPRPKSCVPSCGWPSNHSAMTVGTLLLLCWDGLHDRDELPLQVKVARAALAAAALLPQPWARMRLGDATFSQVSSGCVLGAVLAIVWIRFLTEPLRWFLVHLVLRRSDSPRASAAGLDQEVEIELSAMQARPRSETDCSLLDEEKAKVEAASRWREAELPQLESGWQFQSEQEQRRLSRWADTSERGVGQAALAAGPAGGRQARATRAVSTVRESSAGSEEWSDGGIDEATGDAPAAVLATPHAAAPAESPAAPAEEPKAAESAAPS